MNNLRIIKNPHYLSDSIHFADVSQKFITQAFTSRSAFDNAGDVDKFHDGWNDFFGLAHGRELIQTRIRHLNDADIGFNSAEGIIIDINLSFSQSLKKG